MKSGATEVLTTVARLTVGQRRYKKRQRAANTCRSFFEKSVAGETEPGTFSTNAYRECAHCELASFRGPLHPLGDDGLCSIVRSKIKD